MLPVGFLGVPWGHVRFVVMFEAHEQPPRVQTAAQGPKKRQKETEQKPTNSKKELAKTSKESCVTTKSVNLTIFLDLDICPQPCCDIFVSDRPVVNLSPTVLWYNCLPTSRNILYVFIQLFIYWLYIYIYLYNSDMRPSLSYVPVI